MCRSAGNAVSAFGVALQVDSARTAETRIQGAAAGGGSGSSSSTPRSATGALPLAEGPATALSGVESEPASTESIVCGIARKRRSGSLGSGRPMSAELLAFQLEECAREMEDHLKIQVSTTVLIR